MHGRESNRREGNAGGLAGSIRSPPEPPAGMRTTPGPPPRAFSARSPSPACSHLSCMEGRHAFPPTKPRAMARVPAPRTFRGRPRDRGRSPSSCGRRRSRCAPWCARPGSRARATCGGCCSRTRPVSSCSRAGCPGRPRQSTTTAARTGRSSSSPASSPRPASRGAAASSARCRAARCVPGTVAIERPETIHRVENTSTRGAVTLHLYTPPIRAMNRLDEASAPPASWEAAASA